MKIKAYHCSPNLFDNFNWTLGNHFGSLESAFEATKRKDNFRTYIYEVEIDTSNLVEVFDVGSTENWIKVKKQESRNGFSGVLYKNLYEPSSKPSYFIWDSNLIKVLSITCQNLIEVNKFEKFLTTFYSRDVSLKNKKHKSKFPEEYRQYSTWSLEEDEYLLSSKKTTTQLTNTLKRGYKAIDSRKKLLKG